MKNQLSKWGTTWIRVVSAIFDRVANQSVVSLVFPEKGDCYALHSANRI